ncbi:MAG: isoprenylcysteine carboxylmethyltransferase family protein [Planctomycetota bacterium]|nr:isoprenylcysteine carboxylmethyltransferase family protein [Planctomycetota bacterium]
MVDESKPDRPRPAWIAGKMVVYTVAFLALVLVGLPSLFNWIGDAIFSPRVHEFLEPRSTQSWIGIAVFTVGIAGYFVSSLWLVIVGKGPFVEFDPPTRFVASGPYRWMRNPVAAMLLVTVLGEGLYFGSAGILALFLWGLHVAHLQVLSVEEPRLEKRFGQSYTDYCQRVPRWIPGKPSPDQAPQATDRKTLAAAEHP